MFWRFLVTSLAFPGPGLGLLHLRQPLVFFPQASGLSRVGVDSGLVDELQSIVMPVLVVFPHVATPGRVAVQGEVWDFEAPALLNPAAIDYGLEVIP